MMTTPTLLYINFRRLFRESIVAFQDAKRSGYNVLVIGKPLPSELNVFVDHHEACDPSNQASLLSCLDKVKNIYSISGIVCFTETAVEATAIAGEYLGLPSLTLDAAHSVRDKSVLRNKTSSIDNHKILVLKDEGCEEKILNYAKTEGFPFVIKPINSSGSTGIFIIRSADDIIYFINKKENVENTVYDTSNRYQNTTFILEPYIDGAEYSVEGFVSNGRVTVVGVTQKTTSEPFRLEVRHVFPAALEGGVLDIIHQKSELYIKATGLNNVAFHLEGKLHNKGEMLDFYLIEVAGRPAGDYITSHLIPLATDYHYYENLARAALGETISLPKNTRAVAGIHFILASTEGKLTGYTGLDEVLNHPWVQYVFPEVPIGQTIVLPPKDFRKQRLLSVLSTAPTHDLLQEHLDWVEKILTPCIAI